MKGHVLFHKIFQVSDVAHGSVEFRFFPTLIISFLAPNQLHLAVFITKVKHKQNCGYNTSNFISITSVSPLSKILKDTVEVYFIFYNHFSWKVICCGFTNPNNLLMRPKKVVLICKNEKNILKNWHCNVIGQNFQNHHI